MFHSYSQTSSTGATEVRFAGIHRALDLLSFKKSALGAENATRKEPERFQRLLLAIALKG